MAPLQKRAWYSLGIGLVLTIAIFVPRVESALLMKIRDLE
jgi:hypothetical protein